MLIKNELSDDEDEFVKKQQIYSEFSQQKSDAKIDIDFFRKSFVQKVQMLNSEDGKDVFDSILFFNQFILLAKNRDLVEFFLSCTNSFTTIINIFMNDDIPFVIEASLELITNIMTFVKIDISSSEIPSIVDRILFLFTYGIPPLSKKILNFMIIMNTNELFCQLMIERGAFELSHHLIMGESALDKNHYELESEAFCGLLNFPFNSDCLLFILIQIECYLVHSSTQVKINALSMIAKLDEHKVPTSFLLRFVEYIIPMSAARKKLLDPLVRILATINDDDFLKEIFILDFRNNLAFQCIDKRLSSKIRTSIYKLFLRATSFFSPTPDDLIFVPAMTDSIESYKERKASFKLIAAACQSTQFAVDLAQVGFERLLFYSLDDYMTGLSKTVFKILELIAIAFEKIGWNLQEIVYYHEISEKLAELKLSEEFSSPKRQAMIEHLQNYYFESTE